MTLRIQPGRVEGTLPAPPSKSYTHRAFILGALSGNGLVRRPLLSDDTEATLDALRGLGFLVAHEAAGTRVGGVLRASKRPLDMRESGTTLRLLVPLAALMDAPTTFTGSPRLAARPMGPLVDAVRQLGATVETGRDGFPIIVRGPLRGGTCRIAGDVSSQFLTGLLLAAPFCPEETVIEVTTPLTSRPYVDVTLEMMREHGLAVLEEGNHFLVPPHQRIRQRPFDVPGDYSSAAFLFSAAAVTGGRVTVEGLREKDEQGDQRILEDLAAFGATVEREGPRVTVEGGTLHGARLDVGPTPDLFPVLAAVAALANGESQFSGAPHLRFKESDRIRAMHENLVSFRIHSEERPDGLLVRGGKPQGTRIHSFNDHRVAMAGVVLALAAQGESTLPDPEVVRKSYPGFLQDLATIAPGVTA